MNKKRSIFVLILIAPLFCNVIHAEIYKCVDKNGEVSFRTEPGPGCTLVPTSVSQSNNGEASKDFCATAPKIELNFNRTDIKSALTLLGDLGGVNLIYKRDIKGKVSIRTERLPFCEALNKLLKPLGYSYRIDGEDIVISKYEKGKIYTDDKGEKYEWWVDQDGKIHLKGVGNRLSRVDQPIEQRQKSVSETGGYPADTKDPKESIELIFLKGLRRISFILSPDGYFGYKDETSGHQAFRVINKEISSDSGLLEFCCKGYLDHVGGVLSLRVYTKMRTIETPYGHTKYHHFAFKRIASATFLNRARGIVKLFEEGKWKDFKYGIYGLLGKECDWCLGCP